MKFQSVLGKIIGALAIAAALFFVITFGGLLFVFKDYSEPGLGIQSHPLFQDKTFEKYRIPLKEANRQYFQSDDVYYFFAKEIKEYIAGECIERYLKDHNITDADGWRFPINVNLEYTHNNVSDDDVNEKFVESIRKSEKLGYKEPQWFHDYKYNKTIDCNLSLNKSFEAYVKGYKKFYGKTWREYNNDWVDYLFNNYK